MSTQNKYVKKQKSRDQEDKAPENEIRMTGTSYVGKYITYAASRLLDTEQKTDSIVLKATGVAAKGACLVAEILKHRIKNLHQVNHIKTITVIDEYEPLEEGLDHVSIERTLAVLEIHLSRKDGVLDTKAPGYQKPLPESEVQEEGLEEFLNREGRVERRGERGERRGRGRRGGRGGRGGRGRGEGGYERRGEGRGERRGRGIRGDRKAGRITGGRGGRRPELEDEDYEEERDFQPREGGRRGDRRGGRRGERRGGYDRPYERRPQSSQGGRRINQPK